MSDRYRSRGPGRALWITVVTLAIVLVPLYGIVTLLPPLPAARVVRLASDLPARLPAPDLGLPAAGAAAVVAPDGSVVGTSGDVKQVPMAGAAKTVLAMVTLSVRPLGASDKGPAIPIGVNDLDALARFQGQGARVVPVALGDTWSERELLNAVVLGAANNLTDTLERWAFSSQAEYLTAAKLWLQQHGLADTVVVDGDGLSAKNLSTATDLAKLARLASRDAAMAAILSRAPLPGQKPVEDYIGYRAGTGITTISRGYTDAAGVCLLFSTQLPTLPEGDDGQSVFVAVVGQDGYPQLSTALDAMLAKLPTALVPVQVLKAGQPVARLETDWGETADLVVSRDLTVVPTGQAPRIGALRVPPVSTIPKGRPAGTVDVDSGGTRTSYGLKTDGRIADPGLGWRFAHPAAMASAFLTMF